MLGLGHHCSSPEGAGGSKSLGVDRCTERLVRHMVSSRLHPGRGFSSLSHDAFELFDDQAQLLVIGGNKAMLISVPQWHDGERSLCHYSLQQRYTVATT